MDARSVAILSTVALLVAGCASAPPAPSAQLSSASRLKVADAAASAGNRDMAAAMYARAINDPGLDATARIRAADMLVQYGHPDTAEAALIERLQTAPNEIEVRRALARLHILGGKAASAVADCDTLLAHNPHDIVALTDKAVALDLLGRHGEAQPLYRAVLAIAPDDAAVRSNLALSEALDGKMNEATAALAPLQNRPDLPDRVKTDMGLLYAAGGDAAASRSWLDGRAADDHDVAMVAQALRSRTPVMTP